VACKERDAELGLECLDLRRQRRLLNSQPRGGTGHMTFFSDRYKVTQVS
jgi:hypothetical protein